MGPLNPGIVRHVTYSGHCGSISAVPMNLVFVILAAAFLARPVSAATFCSIDDAGKHCWYNSPESCQCAVGRNGICGDFDDSKRRHCASIKSLRLTRAT